MKFAIEDRHLSIVKNILAAYPYRFYIFGSRAYGVANKFSDLDLCYDEDIPINIIIKLEEEFEESDLPYKVDILDLNSCDDEFRSMIESKMMLFISHGSPLLP